MFLHSKDFTFWVSCFVTLQVNILGSISGSGYVVAGANLGYTLQRIRQDTLCMLFTVFTFGGSVPAITAHGSLDFKQEIQIQIQSEHSELLADLASVLKTLITPLIVTCIIVIDKLKSFFFLQEEGKTLSPKDPSAPLWPALAVNNTSATTASSSVSNHKPLFKPATSGPSGIDCTMGEHSEISYARL
jgi:hypothetical protein